MKHHPILATCTLSSPAPGQAFGDVTFEIRGTFPVSLTLEGRDDKGAWQARLRVGRYEAMLLQMLAIPAGFDEQKPEGDVEHFHGYITIEGYVMQARVEKRDGGMVCWFLDALQPLPPKPEWYAPDPDVFDRDLRDLFREPAE